jgi:hypothetical protein
VITAVRFANWPIAEFSPCSHRRKRRVIRGGAGNDWIHGGLGNDTIEGGPGRDDLWGGPGSERILARDGQRDTIHCGDYPRDIVVADRIDVVNGRCKRVEKP